MDQLIDQIIAHLSAAPDATRRAHPLFTAIAAVLAAAPDDHADLERFLERPPRYASVLRALLAARLPQDAKLHQALEALITDLSGDPNPTTAAPSGDTITVGDIPQSTGVAIGAGARSTVLQFFFTAAGIADPSSEQQELVAAYLARLAQRCDRLRLSGAVQRERRDAGPPLTLSQVYVERYAREGYGLRLTEAVEGYDLEGRLRLTAALNRRKRLVLLGGPGSGKSSFLRSLAYGHWQDDPSRWREVIFLALGRMVRGEGRETAAGWPHFLLAPAHGERTRTDDERQRAAFFAHECMREMGGKAALIGVSTVDLPALWADLAAGLAMVVEGTALSATDRVQAGVWLGEFGDSRPGVCDLPPAMVELSGGSFEIGMTLEEIEQLPESKRAYFDRNKNDRPITIAAFTLARYPVTNAQYQRFIDAGGYDTQAPWWDKAGQAWLRENRRSEPRYWSDERFGIARPNHPVVGVSWYEATAFCRWLTQRLDDGYEYRLPSEAEWEYAARSATRRIYPWGDDEPDGERANFNEIYNSTSAVGCFPRGATPEGILDLAGNVWEWTRSEYRSYPYDPDDGREVWHNPAQERLTLRGGSWFDPPLYLRAACRDHNTPGFRNYFLGCRFARRRCCS